MRPAGPGIGAAPRADTRNRLTSGAQVREGTTDGEGRIIENEILATASCEIEWGVSNDDNSGPILSNFAEVLLNASNSTPGAGKTRLQLANLGFQSDIEAENLQAFKDDYQEPEASAEIIDEAHQSGRPKAQRTILV